MQFENQCSYIDATISQFLEWLDESNEKVQDKKRKLNTEHSEANASFEENPFKNYDPSVFWAYCDYKHMIEFLKPESCLKENV